MTANEAKAYEIGVRTANTERRIVPAVRSTEMMAFMNDVKNNLNSIIKAYNLGVAHEISRQTRAELGI